MAKLAIFTERYTIRSSVELTALTNFRQAAFELGHQLDFLFKSELKYLRNYDGVLIRALTDPLNATYVVARVAEMNGLRVIDTSESIRICCDKVNMYSRLMAHAVPMPDTRFLDRHEVNAENAAELFETLGMPLVLKAPNSSFSAYVDRATNSESFVKIGRKFLRRADRVVVQQYMPSEFDWRVITLAGRVLAVVKYQFVQDKWKTMERGPAGEWSRTLPVPREEAEPRLLEVALAAAGAISGSLHGIDIKEVDGEFYVIEVNDNPNIDAGGEDRANSEIYAEIIRHLAGDA
ncbi:MAG TPA: ATP-grasp domain-containing protein [Trueperaceae bacterium]